MFITKLAKISRILLNQRKLLSQSKTLFRIIRNPFYKISLYNFSKANPIQPKKGYVPIIFRDKF